MSSTYDISTEQDQIVIRIHPPGADREALTKLLDFLELEATRKRSALSEDEAAGLAREVKDAAWAGGSGRATSG